MGAPGEPPAPEGALLERRPRWLLSADYGPAFTQVDDLGEPVGEPVWLEPYPTPEDRYELRESVELPFVAAWERADVPTPWRPGSSTRP
jgi:hypothetical protein